MSDFPLRLGTCSTRGTELAELVEAGAQQIVGALRAACDEGLSVPQLTELLGVALRHRNQCWRSPNRPPP